ncbi:MAG: sensor histidine kinase, partial [Bacteroidota bacterium]
RFLTDSKDREIAALNELNALRASQIGRQHTIRNIIIILFLVTGVFLYTLYRSNRRKVEINRLLLAHQDELEKRSEELEELNKLKDKFFSIISHDLRSPINSLAGVLNLMDKNGVSPEELPELTRELRMQFNHTRGLITNLLNWAMLQMDKVTIQKESLNLNQLVDENLKLAAATSSKKLELINEVPETLAIRADRNMMNLLVRNLVTNSIKFTDNGGYVKVNAEESGKEVIIAVEDNGVGMSPEIQETLLEKKSINYTTRGTANEKGTGLGLSLCKEFLERNNGRIWLKSSEGVGTTFYIAVPRT